jgi:hypothetical protein
MALEHDEVRAAERIVGLEVIGPESVSVKLAVLSAAITLALSVDLASFIAQARSFVPS